MIEFLHGIAFKNIEELREFEETQENQPIYLGDTACNREYEMRSEIYQQKLDYEKALEEEGNKYFNPFCKYKRVSKRKWNPKLLPEVEIKTISFTVGW